MLVLQKLLQLFGFSCAKGSSNISEDACMASVVFVLESLILLTELLQFSLLKQG